MKLVAVKLNRHMGKDYDKQYHADWPVEIIEFENESGPPIHIDSSWPIMTVEEYRGYKCAMDAVHKPAIDKQKEKLKKEHDKLIKKSGVKSWSFWH